MGWFSGLGHELGDLVGAVDKAAVVANPLHGVMGGLANEASKIPGVGKYLGEAGSFGNNHPFEAYLAASAAEAGGSALGGLGGDAGLAADAGANAGMALEPGAAADLAGNAGMALDAGAAADLAGNAGMSAADNLSFLPATGSDSVNGVANLSPDLAQQLGVSNLGADVSTTAADSGVNSGIFGADTSASGVTTPDFGGVGTDPSVAASPDGGAAASNANGIWDSIKNYGGDIASWAKAHPTQAAMLAFATKNAMTGGKLPAGASTANAASTAEVQQAQGIIQSGGQSSPLWAAQKASIDSSIDANLKNAIEAAKQTAANNGMGGTNSAVVQQQINKLTSDANTQKQQLYAQALNQIVSQAVSMLSGGNATLTNIAQLQMRSSEQAQATAAQTAELALQLGSLKKTVPDSTGGP